MYQRRSRLGARKQGELIKLFVAGSTARAAAEIVGAHRNTASSYFMRLRQLIASKTPSYKLSGEIDADESYFGGVRKGKRSRGAAGKVAVFGLHTNDLRTGSSCRACDKVLNELTLLLSREATFTLKHRADHRATRP